MLIYVFTFAFSILMIYMYEKSKSKIIKRITLILSITGPAIIAGLRADTIGTDTRGYAKNIYEAAAASNNVISFYSSHIFYEWHAVSISYFEPGYTFLAFICQRMFNSFQGFLLFSELFILIPFYEALINYKEKYKISLLPALLLFYGLFYNVTYNAMRQSISVAFLFLAISIFYTKNDIKKCILFLLISVMFHRSSIVYALFIFVIIFFINNGRKGETISIGSKTFFVYKIYVWILGLLGICLIFGGNKLLFNIISGIGLAKLAWYINGNVTFSINQLLLLLPLILIIFYSRNGLKKNINESNAAFYYFGSCMFYLNVILSQLSTITSNSWRCNLLFSCMSIVYFPFIQSNVKSKQKRLVIKIVIIMYCIFYWYYMFVYLGRHGTVPYSFYR